MKSAWIGYVIGALALTGCVVGTYSGMPPTVSPVSAQTITGAGEVGSSTIPTFSDHVAPILYRHCVSCHRPGQIAPFSLVSYEDARSRAGFLSKVVDDRLMPPWKPEPGYGAFRYSRAMPEADRATLREWAKGGAPLGDPGRIPPVPPAPPLWELGPPDVILEMPQEFTVPAEGADPYRNFVIPTNFGRDRHVRAVQFVPGNRRVVHHAVVYIDKTGEAAKKQWWAGGASKGYNGLGGPGFIPSGGLPGFVPGASAQRMAPDTTILIPKGADIVFGMHYHPTGKVEKDRSKIGLYFADRPGKRRGSLILTGVVNLDIPAGASRHTVQSRFEVPVDVELNSIGPHMHLIGRAAKVWAVKPDGTEVPLIWIRNWDFRWQSTYTFQNPVRLPKGSVIHSVYTHDNSADNPANPQDPPQRVKNGENSTDEMAGAWIEVTVDTWQQELSLIGALIGHVTDMSFRPAKRSEAKINIVDLVPTR